MRGVELQHQRGADAELAERVGQRRQPGHLGDLRRGARPGDAGVEARVELHGVGGAVPDDGQRALDRQARLVRQDRHRHACPQPRQLAGIAGRDRLLDVLQVVGGEAVEQPLREPRRPGAVGVDPQPRPVADRLADGAHARLVHLGREADLEVQRAEPLGDPRPRVLRHRAPARRARGRRGSRSASARRRPTAGAAAGPKMRPVRSQSAVSMPDSAHDTPCVPRCAMPVSAYRRRRIEVVVERVGADHQRRHRLDHRASSPRRCRPTPPAPRRCRSGPRR